MPTFDAAGEDLTFDFTKYVPDCKGEVPEPSSAQIEALLTVLRELMPTKTNEDGKIVLDLTALNEKFKEHPEAAEVIVNQAFSDVCSNVMTPENIEALPFRVKQRFYGWVTGTFLSPEA